MASNNLTRLLIDERNRMRAEINLGRVDIYVKLSVIVGARSPRLLTNVGWNPQTILELIVGLYSYLDIEPSIFQNRPTVVQNRL